MSFNPFLPPGADAGPLVNERTCRNCSHGESRHTEEMFNCGYVARFLTEHNVTNFCPCYAFVSNDNLEYLELKVKQKEDETLRLV